MLILPNTEPQQQTASQSLHSSLIACRDQLVAKQTPDTPIAELRTLQTATLLCDVFAQMFEKLTQQYSPLAFMRGAQLLANWYAAVAVQVQAQSSTGLILPETNPQQARPDVTDVAQTGFAWAAIAQSSLDAGLHLPYLPASTTAIWATVTASLVAATTAQNRREAMMLMSLLRQISNETAVLAAMHAEDDSL